MVEIVIIGVLFAVLFYELTDIAPGGIIVPAIFVLYLTQPIKIVYTLAVALAAWGIVLLLSKKFAIFGKRRFAILIVLSFLLHLVVGAFTGLFTEGLTGSLVSLVGYTVTGVLANNIYKQGPVKTIGSLAVVVGLLECVVLMLTAFGVAL